MIDNITIERLRGIRKCFLDDFGRFNIFLGHNNCGKTTVLEAIYLSAIPRSWWKQANFETSDNR